MLSVQRAASERVDSTELVARLPLMEGFAQSFGDRVDFSGLSPASATGVEIWIYSPASRSITALRLRLTSTRPSKLLSLLKAAFRPGYSSLPLLVPYGANTLWSLRMPDFHGISASLPCDSVTAIPLPLTNRSFPDDGSSKEALGLLLDYFGVRHPRISRVHLNCMFPGPTRPSTTAASNCFAEVPARRDGVRDRVTPADFPVEASDTSLESCTCLEGFQNGDNYSLACDCASAYRYPWTWL